jgi:hypothetical protein
VERTLLFNFGHSNCNSSRIGLLEGSKLYVPPLTKLKCSIASAYLLPGSNLHLFHPFVTFAEWNNEVKNSDAIIVQNHGHTVLNTKGGALYSTHLLLNISKDGIQYY